MPNRVGAMIRDCERFCPKCEQWKHHSRFRSWRDSRVRSDSGIQFAQHCRDCEQIKKNERLNEDRPLVVFRRRTATRAAKLGVPFDFLWVNMNWRSLLPDFRIALTTGATCHACGHPYLHERDVQIEHREPPRHPQDWAREHARNIAFYCASCNRTKREKSYASWLDEQEDARLANEAHRKSGEIGAIIPMQLSFDC